MVRSHGGRQKQNVTSYIAIHGAAAKGPDCERPCGPLTTQTAAMFAANKTKSESNQAEF